MWSLKLEESEAFYERVSPSHSGAAAGPPQAAPAAGWTGPQSVGKKMHEAIARGGGSEEYYRAYQWTSLRCEPTA